MIHIFYVNPVAIEKNQHVFKICFTAYKYVNELLYPCEVPLEAVDVQLRLLGVDVGADGEEVLRRGNMAEREVIKDKYINKIIKLFYLTEIPQLGIILQQKIFYSCEDKLIF